MSEYSFDRDLISNRTLVLLSGRMCSFPSNEEDRPFHVPLYLQSPKIELVLDQSIGEGLKYPGQERVSYRS